MNDYFTKSVPKPLEVTEENILHFKRQARHMANVDEENIIKIVRMLNSYDLDTRTLAMGLVKNLVLHEKTIIANFIVFKDYKTPFK